MLEKNFTVEAGRLEIGGVDLSYLKEKYGTPLYIFDQALFKETASTFKKNFKSDLFKSHIVYASKAFSNLYIMGLCKKLGLKVDCVSEGEIYTALKAGIAPSDIYFHGNNKTEEEIDFAIKNGVETFVIDNPKEFERLSETCKKYGRSVKALLRINPDVRPETHKFIQTSNPDSKFGMGMEAEDTKELIGALISDSNIDFQGFHAHIGSQVSQGGFFFEEADIMLSYLKKIQDEFSYKLKSLDLGGGFGVEQKKGDSYLDLPSFLKDYRDFIEGKISEYGLELETIALEPGRSLINQAGNILYTVGNVKKTQEGLPLVFVDGGMSDNIRPSLYEADYDAILANKMDEAAKVSYRVGGKLCESGDILIKRVDLPEAGPGDLLLVPSAGAYTFAMFSTYNKLARPGVVFVEDGKDYLAVKRDSLDDLVRNEVAYRED